MIRYDIWKVDPSFKNNPVVITGERKYKQQNRYIRVNPEERFITSSQQLLIRVFVEDTKKTGMRIFISR
jgi:hypothetical protein